ncbi:cytochrome P450 [Candidatus Thioglobus sp.]|uniref:cytochrome P450 n=1 Tax=Candidatus Thioglobus sp. TaxID=2026721 RepID=UPI003D144A4F
MTLEMPPNESSFDLPDFRLPNFQENPYPYYQAARDISPIFWSPRHRQYFVLGGDAMRAVLRQKEFIVDSPFRASRILFGRTIVDVDGEEHARLRSVTNRGLVPAKYPEYIDQIVKPIIHDQLKPLIQNHGGDFVNDFANHVPTRIMSTIIGIPVEEYETFYQLSIPITQFLDVANQDNLAKAKAAMSTLTSMVIEICNHKRTSPDDTIIGSLLKAQASGAPISDEEIIRQVGLMIPAAIDTTNRLIGNALYLLVRYPIWQKKIRQSPDWVFPFIEEVMRYEPPIHSSIRIVKEAVTIEGIDLPQGALLNINFAAANRDASCFENPDAFNPMRDSVKRHFSFGGGKHQCMGRSFAILEVAEVVLAIVNTGKELYFQPDEPCCIEGVAFRSPAALRLILK